MTTSPRSAVSWYSRPEARQWRCAPLDQRTSAFHARLPGFRPTPLAEVPELAEELGVGRVFVKDESARLSLGAFKVLGASWAIARLLAGPAAGVPDSLAALRQAAADHPVELVTATDGNHGRAVAWMGHLLGLPVRVFVPQVISARTAAAIMAEGAEVVLTETAYDSAVRQAATYADARPGRLLVQDTAWPGYQRVPAWIMAGYGTMLREIDGQLRDRGVPGPDLVSVPVGVGTLAQAVVTHYRSGAPGRAGPAVLSVEPGSAACVLASLQAGAPQSVATAATVMAGLNCGTLSSLAWPVLAAGLDAAVAVTDQSADRAAADLARLGIESGPSGAASLAGLRAALGGQHGQPRRPDLPVTSSSVLVLLNTEGTQLTGPPH